jgi:Skp family chaperone for outer membrane proteins
MKFSRYLACCAFLAVLLLPTLSGSRACAQTMKIAVVDMDAVSDQYKEFVDKQAELQAWVAEKKGLITALQEFMFLSSSEFQEIINIYQTRKSNWTDAQRKREAELRKVSDDNEKRFLDLQAKTGRTAEEQNQFNTLRDTYQARDADMGKFSKQLEDELKTKRLEIQTKMVGNLRTVIETVSKAHACTLVIDKSAVHYFAAPVEDLTADVLKALNGTVPTTPPAGGGNAPGG